jgi:NlpC/P60 family
MTCLSCISKLSVLKILKPLTVALAIAFLLTSCQAMKPTGRSVSKTGTNGQFLDNISISSSPGHSLPGVREEKVPDLGDEKTQAFNVNDPAFNIEFSIPLQFKYAILLDTEVEKISNQSLIEYIEEWWGAPYRFGGQTRNGIDCSAFVQGLLSTVYNISVPRVAREQKNLCETISPDSLQEGDLVFFNTRGGVSHVGVYLRNNKFVHASVTNGVIISDLDEVYWERRYLGAGRPKNDGMARTEGQ